jgi:8-hydroxy-5-deazaflavin:NADPH oxidoreductase
MKISVLGTGAVGRVYAAKLAELGHDVMIGTRDISKTLKSNQKDPQGNPPFSVWHTAHPAVRVGSLPEAAGFGDIVINALLAKSALSALEALRSDLDGKILVDITNAMDFSTGFPPTFFIVNTDSLGEQIQRALPDTKVVKTLNTVSALIQTDPYLVASGDHHVFLSGNDADAKTRVMEILRMYGWQHILDLGDITTSRGVEMYMALWARLYPVLNTPFNIKIQTGK